MTTIDYTYEIISVGDSSMQVVYSNPTFGSLHVGVRLPYEGEDLEAVIAEASPALWWLEQSKAKFKPAVGVSGSGHSVIATPPQDLSADLILDMWRENSVISQLQAHHTLKVWGLYDQVEALVQSVGDPMELAFNRATEWRRNSPTINAMFKSITLSDGTVPSDEDVDRFFVEAAEFFL